MEACSWAWGIRIEHPGFSGPGNETVRIMIAVGDEVKAGQGLIVMEAIKMWNEMKSPKDGNAQKILTSEGSTANPGDTLAVIA